MDMTRHMYAKNRDIHVCIHMTCLIHIFMVSFAEYSLFYRALLQKRPIILRSTNRAFSRFFTRFLSQESRECAEKSWLRRITYAHCNTLQHTATHCNTLQHTAAYCNTLQHTAAHRNTHGSNQSCYTRKAVRSHVWMSHVTHTNGSCHTYLWSIHVTPMNMCDTNDSIMWHTWKIHELYHE